MKPTIPDSMPALRALLFCTLGGVLLPAVMAGEVRRCEDEHGAITYSNEPCPTGTARERSVDRRPAMENPGGNGAPVAPAAHAGGSPHPTADARPGGERQREERRNARARCEDLARRIESVQQDLMGAIGSERDSMELGLRRLREEYADNCTDARP
jgi:hypothetical protein